MNVRLPELMARPGALVIALPVQQETINSDYDDKVPTKRQGMQTQPKPCYHVKCLKLLFATEDKGIACQIPEF